MSSQGSKSSKAVDRVVAGSFRPANLGAVAETTVSLAMGEPDFDTPDVVRAAAVEALAAGRTRYTAPVGDGTLRAAIAHDLLLRDGAEFATSGITVTHGGSAALAATMLGLLDRGDRVLLPEPTYSLYADQALFVGAEPVWIPNDADGRLDLERIEELAGSASMIVICNPGNPTGRVFGADELQGLVDIAVRHPSLIVVADEAYRDIVFDGIEFRSLLSFEELREQIVYCGTFSKTYAMTGWRLGFVATGSARTSAISTTHRTFNGSVNTFVQDAGLAALQEVSREAIGEMRAVYQRRRDIVVSALEGVEGVSLLSPQGAFYAFPRIDASHSSVEIAAAAGAGGVLVRAGREFGPSGEGHVRLSFATSDAALELGLERLLRVVSKLQRASR